MTQIDNLELANKTREEIAVQAYHKDGLDLTTTREILLESFKEVETLAKQEERKRVVDWAEDKKEKCQKLKTGEYLTETPQYFEGKIAILDDLINQLTNDNN